VQRLKQLIANAEANELRLAALEAASSKAAPAPPAAAAPAKVAKKNTVPAQIFYSKSGKFACSSIMAMLALRPQDPKALKLVNRSTTVEVPSVRQGTLTLEGEDVALMFLGRLTGLTPQDNMAAIATESWVAKAFAAYRDAGPLSELNDYLTLRTFSVGYQLSTSDVALWSVLSKNKVFQAGRKSFMHLNRYFSFLDGKLAPLVEVKEEEVKAKSNKNQGKKKGGKSKKQESKDDAAGSSLDVAIKYHGRIFTRFPPEPNGFLHLGHTKALLFNCQTAAKYGGKMGVRFDDTNPEKEKEEFEEAILNDIKALGVQYAQVTHTSDYFGYMLECCEEALKRGDFYIDGQSQEDMQAERMEKRTSPARKNSVEQNLALWKEMLAGKEGMVVRAKLDPASDNGTLRDPTMARVMKVSHHRTKDKYCVYPNYDFACPIADTLDGVTHAMRSNEYNERNVQYLKLWDMTMAHKKDKNGKGYEKPEIFQFSRLDFMHTTLSKRKLQKLVDEGVVSGWDDPRMPTVRGLLRRGITTECFHEFMAAAAGGSTRNNCQSWDKILAMNKNIINMKAARFWAVKKQDVVPLTISNLPKESVKTVPVNPVNKEDQTTRFMQISNRLLVDQFDAVEIKSEGELINLTSVGNVKITKIEKKGDVVTALTGEFVAPPTDPKALKKWYRGKTKLSWIADCGDQVSITKIDLDHLLIPEQLPDGVDWNKEWRKYVNMESWKEEEMIGEQGLRKLQKGDIIQLQRVGFFIVEQPYVSVNTPMKLIYIPDGRTKDYKSKK